VHGDPVWRYLNRRLGIEQVSGGLRLHPGLRYTDEDGRDLGRFPAMLGKIQYPDGTGASIHRTYLTDEGHKAPVPQPKKVMAGKPLNTGAVRLCEAGSTLGIAEGIETALAASIRFRVPAWAATNAALLEAWIPPAGVERVLIAGDNDASYTGQAAAFRLARRLVQEELAVDIRIPEQVGKDWADADF
jgi:putative DNA primase/helicase